jgi:two-component sensor histidine kinase
MLLRFYILIIILGCFNTVAGQRPNEIINREARLADSFDLEARKHLLKWKRDSAKYLLGKALELAKTSGNNTIIARCYIDYVNLYMMQGNFKEARTYLQKAGPFLEKTDHYEIRLSGLLLRANIENFSGRKDSALYYYKLAENYNAKKMPYRNYEVYISMGELYSQVDDFVEAERLFFKAYQLTSRKENKPEHGYVLVILINFYRAKNKPAKAGPLIAEYAELEAERKKKGFVDPLQYILAGIGNMKQEGDLSFMKKVKESSLADGLVQQAIIANSYIINYYEKKKEFETALDFASENDLLAARTGAMFNIYGAKKVRYNLLQEAGRYNEAALLADTLFALKDSLLTLQKREQLFDLEKKYETEKKQNEINLLVSKNEINEKDISLLTSEKKLAALFLQKEILQGEALARENNLMDSIVSSEKGYSLSVTREKEKESALNAAMGRENALKETQLLKEKNLRKVFIGGSALLLLAGTVILLQYRKQRTKNLVIQRQSDDLQVLMKEIHHRVKNNLQVVSSLLDLQSHSITDEQAGIAVKEGRNRVQSMALIHQNLYSEGNIKGIKVKEYIGNLIKALCDSYNISNERVSININIDDLNLDLDTMIPLGLVLNELVSNCFKYAFAETNAGVLNITLAEKAHTLYLRVSDNGIGFPADLNIKTAKSFGLKLIKAFSHKLKARLDIYNNNGAVVEMQISKFKTA